MFCRKKIPPLRLFFAIIRGASHSQTILVIAPTTEGGRMAGEQRKKKGLFLVHAIPKLGNPEEGFKK